MRHALITLALLGGAQLAVAQGNCGLMADPNNPACSQGTGSLPGKTPPRAATKAATGGGAQSPYTQGAPDLPRGVVDDGLRVCTEINRTTGQCYVWASSRSAYETAIQDGIDAAKSGMGIQQDILRRLQAGGAMQTRPQAGLGGVGQGAPVLSGFGAMPGLVGESQATAQPRTFESCVQAESNSLYAAKGRIPSGAESFAIMQKCENQ